MDTTRHGHSDTSFSKKVGHDTLEIHFLLIILKKNVQVYNLIYYENLVRKHKKLKEY